MRKSLADAEALEDPVRDVLAHGASGKLTEGRHSPLRLGKHDIGRTARSHRVERGVHALKRKTDRLGLTEIRENVSGGNLRHGEKP